MLWNSAVSAAALLSVIVTVCVPIASPPCRAVTETVSSPSPPSSPSASSVAVAEEVFLRNLSDWLDSVKSVPESAEELHHADMHADPIGEFLARCRFRVGVTAGAQNSDE